MSKTISATIVLTLFFFFGVSFAQPGGGGPGGGGPPVPIGGIELLLLAGAALGIKKLVGNNKKG